MVRDLGPVSPMKVFVSLTYEIFQMDDYTRMWVEHHAAGKDYMRTGFPTTNHQQVLIRSANIKKKKNCQVGLFNIHASWTCSHVSKMFVEEYAVNFTNFLGI